MTNKLSLREAQDLYQKSTIIRREKEYLRSAMRVKDTLEAGPAPGAMGEGAAPERLGILNDALEVTGDVK